jgi:protein-S-isoprenylcysteine O-methyltransferase Ste14
MVVSIVRATFIVAATAAFFGLAVLGWGGPAAFFSHPALIALAVATFVMAGAALFAGGNISPGVREDRGNRWVIAALALIGVLAAFLPALTDRRSSGPSTATPSAGLASSSSRLEARCGLVITALIIPPLLARIRAEERLLHSQFGAEYDAYRARTSRLIPGRY